MKRETSPSVKKIETNGITGANALWDGPLDVSGFPMGKDLALVKTVWKYPKQIVLVVG